MKHTIVIKPNDDYPLPIFVNEFFVALTQSKEAGKIKDFTWETVETERDTHIIPGCDVKVCTEPAILRVALYDFDYENNEEIVTERDLCDYHSNIAGANYPDNIKMLIDYRIKEKKRPSDSN